jgi:diguanylate cyclase (GGDEF)-like protein
MLMVAVAMTPLFALTVWAAVDERARAAARERANIRRWALLLASGHERLVRDARQLLLVLARVPAVRDGDAEACHALFSELSSRYPQYATLGLARSDGEVIAGTARSEGARAWIREQILRRAVETGTLATGLPRLSGEARLPTVFLAQAVRGRAGWVVVFASVELTWLDPKVAFSELPERAAASVFDPSGIVLGRHPRPRRWRGIVASRSALFRAIEASKGKGTAEVPGLDEVRRLYGFARLGPSSGASSRAPVLALGVPLDLAFAESRSLERKSLLALSGVMLLGLAGAWLGGDRLVVRLFGRALEAADRDSLTGLLSRRRILARGQLELQRARRFGHALAALMVDVDRFKEVNDRLGHPAGDEVLRQVAARCAASIREVDLAGRYGGEEFLVILPETGLAEAKEAAERLRARISDAPITTQSGSLMVTVSVGAVSAQNGSASLAALVQAADRALYAAKATGRNRVVAVAPPPARPRA